MLQVKEKTSPSWAHRVHGQYNYIMWKVHVVSFQQTLCLLWWSSGCSRCFLLSLLFFRLNTIQKHADVKKVNNASSRSKLNITCMLVLSRQCCKLGSCVTVTGKRTMVSRLHIIV